MNSIRVPISLFSGGGAGTGGGALGVKYEGLQLTTSSFTGIGTGAGAFVGGSTGGGRAPGAGEEDCEGCFTGGVVRTGGGSPLTGAGA